MINGIVGGRIMITYANTESKPRDFRIDMVKGICICLVVFAHFQHIGKYSLELIKGVSIIYTFHMPVFILLSGYLFGNKQGRLIEFGRVWSRMFKPYFVMAPIVVLLYQLAGTYGISTTNQVEWGIMPYCRILIGEGGAALWYLYTFGVAELLALVALRWMPSRIREELGNAAWVVVIVGTICCLMAYCGFCIAPNKIFYFFIGFFLRRSQSALPCSVWFLGSAALIFGFIGVSESFTLGNCVWVISVLGSLMWLAKGLLSVRWLSKVLVYCGEHTLSILLFHNLISVVLRPLASKMLAVDPSGIGISLLMTGVIVVLSLCAEVIIKKTWFRKLLF